MYSQKNPRWMWQKLGTCKDTISKSGCKVTCFAMFLKEIKNPDGKMVEAHPGIVDWVATEEKLYTNGCLINDKIFCKYFGLEYVGNHTTAPKYPCIAETNHYQSKGVPQHFFIHLPNGNIIDPLDYIPREKKNQYKIVSYRWIKPLGWVAPVVCNKQCPKCCK